MELIAAFVPVLLLAVLLGLFMARIGQLPIMGYLLAGVIYGSVHLPSSLQAETLGFLGELGIILLLFYLGMKLSWRQVAPIVGRSFGLAIAVAGVPFLFTHGALLLLGMSAGEALLAGFALSMTSTAIGFQILEVRGELSGRLALLVNVTSCDMFE